MAGLASNYWDSHKSAIYKSIHNDLDTYKLSEEQKVMMKEIDKAKINKKDMEAFYSVKTSEKEN